MKKKHKNIREKGKIKLSRMFQKFKEGEKVAIIRELSIHSNIPRKYQGRTGKIDGMRGRSYIISVMDLNKEKRLIVNPIHLKKIKESN